MPQNSCVSPEKKIEVVEKYFRGEMGATQIIDELGTTWSSLKRWTILYKTGCCRNDTKHVSCW